MRYFHFCFNDEIEDDDENIPVVETHDWYYFTVSIPDENWVHTENDIESAIIQAESRFSCDHNADVETKEIFSFDGYGADVADQMPIMQFWKDFFDSFGYHTGAITPTTDKEYHEDILGMVYDTSVGYYVDP